MICKWKACRDETSGYTFYWNKETGETTWDRPEEEPIEELEDTNSGDGVDEEGQKEES